MNDDEQIVFAKIDAHLDDNPKIGNAGPLARDVYAFVLRVNAYKGSHGWIKSSYIEPTHLSRRLRWDVMLSAFLDLSGVTPRDDRPSHVVTCDAAMSAVTALVTEKLLRIDHEAGRVYIVGWDPRWGKKAKSGANRTKEWRAKHSQSQSSTAGVTAVTTCDEKTSRVTAGDAGDTREEKRREEKRQQKPKSAAVVASNPDQPELSLPAEPKPPSPHKQVMNAFDEAFSAAHGGTLPSWSKTNIEHARQLLVAARGNVDEIRRRIHILYTAPPDWLRPPYDIKTVVSNFDKLVAPSAPSTGRRAVDRPGAPSEAL